MQFNKLFNKQGALGIAITQKSITLIELASHAKSYVVKNYAKTIIDNYPTLIDALKHALSQADTRNKQAAIALQHTEILSKTVELDATLTANEITLHLKNSTQHYLNHLDDEILLDFEIKGLSKTNPKLHEVCWVAARKRDAELQINRLAQVGIKVKYIDVNSFALQRGAAAFIQATMPNSGSIAVIHLDKNSLFFIIFENSLVIFTTIENLYPDDLTTLSHQQIAVKIIKLVETAKKFTAARSPSLLLIDSDYLSNELLDNINFNLKLPSKQVDLFALRTKNIPQQSPPFSQGFLISLGLAMKAFL